MRRLHRMGNVFVSLLLRSPLHGTASRSLILITYRGRRSGREYTLPVAYAEDEQGLIVFAGRAGTKTWWRNLRDDTEVRLRLRGTDFAAAARVVPGPSLTDAYVAGQPRSAAAVAREREPVFVRLDHLRPNV